MGTPTKSKGDEVGVRLGLGRAVGGAVGEALDAVGLLKSAVGLGRVEGGLVAGTVVFVGAGVFDAAGAEIAVAA